ncbi:hypothetical protein NMY22_g6537 [Coprinellus aureogranulatus]|nr:hypothetical protein NMY22_g6537 [Coprinellus aureogranulatus]
MASYPEEPLNLSAEDGFGYYPANINQALNGEKYSVIRKLGWGPRSSTWLVRESDGKEGDLWAVQILTAASSKDVAKRLLPILQNDELEFQEWNSFPGVVANFWEKSAHGEHLCLAMNPYGLPLASVLREAIDTGRAGLPVHVVQYATNEVLKALDNLHKEGVMHGGVKLENLVFWPVNDDLPQYLRDNPPADALMIDDLPVVRSQPLDNYKVEWNAPMSQVANWMILLAGYGHIQVSPFAPEPGVDYSSAPETLRTNPTCGPQTDIWMLGCLVFELLTGKSLFTSTNTRAEKLDKIRNLLKDTAQDQSLEKKLKDALTEKEAQAAYLFVRKCFAVDPDARPSAEALQGDAWVKGGGNCSCCYD